MDVPISEAVRVREMTGSWYSEDLRAIPFVGSWSLLKQNVPGYFGVGTALQRLKEEGRLEDLKSYTENLCSSRPLFRIV